MLASQAAVARHFKLSKQAVSQWKERFANCPLRRPGPWSAAELAAWRDANVEPPRGGRDLPYFDGGEQRRSIERDAGAVETLPPAQRAKIAHTVVKTQLEQFKLQRARGEFLPIEDVRRERLGRIATFKSVLLSVPQLISRHPELEELDDDWRQRVELVGNAIVAEALVRMAGAVGRKDGAA